MVKPIFENVIEMIGGLLKAEKKKKKKTKIIPAKFVSKENKPKSKVAPRPIFPAYAVPPPPFFAPFAELRLTKRGLPYQKRGPKGRKALIAEDERRLASALESTELEASSRRRGERRGSESERSSRSKKGTSSESEGRRKASASSASSAESEFVSASEAEPAVRLTKKGLPFKKRGPKPKANPAEVIQSREEIERQLGLSPLKVSVRAKAPSKAVRAKSEELALAWAEGSGKFKKRK